MASNADLKIMEEAGLLEEGLVKGGADKQKVAHDIKKLREKKDDKGIKKYIENLKSERSVSALKSDPNALSALTKLVNDQSIQIKQLTEKIAAKELPKGDAVKTGGN